MEHKVIGSVRNRKFCAALLPSMIRQLGLQNSTMAVLVMIEDGMGDNAGTTVDLGIDGLNCLLVIIKPNKRLKEIALTLAHEMVHVKQMAKGQLKSGNDGCHIWMGKSYPADTPYLDSPWEIDAYSKQELIMRRALEV